MRGILGIKVGMTQIFDDENRVVPVTVVRVGGCRVGQVKTLENDSYAAVQLLLGDKSRKRATKGESGHARSVGVEPAQHIVELRIDEDDAYAPGIELRADVFEAGDIVDVVAVSKGKGFSGVMKRHNFKGLKASHGTHRVHRAPGSIGMAATPGKVQKGKRMAGRHGNARTTVQNLAVVVADVDRELILIKGALPGPNGGLVMVKDAATRSRRTFSGAAKGEK